MALTPLLPRSAMIAGLAVALLSGAGVHAAGLTVAVTDAAGKPLPEAVVILDPVTSRAAVKPMADVDVSQSQRRFNPRVTVITVGTGVRFPNFDTVRHHVYSFSPVKTFELKLYAGVPNAPVVFDKPGVATLGCNIHDQMTAYIVVVETPFHTRTDTTGHAVLPQVPPGDYRLRAWHPGVAPGSEPPAIALTIGKTDHTSTLRLPAEAQP